LLAGTVGGDLWALEQEIRKLAAYAGGRPIDEGMVREVVVGPDDTRIWDLTDAVSVGDERKAVAALARLLAAGQPPPLLSAMVVRQYRHLVIVKDLRERRARQDEIARAAGVPPFRVNALAAVASRYAWPQLRAIYARLLEADLSVKRGLQDDESALQLLVHDLCAAAPARRAAYAR
jgi:DNA polymerase-3 subunit delta